MHFRRLVVAALLLPVLYLYVTKLPQFFFFLLVLAAALVAQTEFYAMYRIKGMPRAFGMLSGAATLLVVYLHTDLYYHAMTASLLLILFLRLAWKKDPSSSLSETAPVVLALLYIPGLFGFQLLLRAAGPQWIIFLFGCVWASDSFAYYAGKSLGRRKLHKEVSPNKTIAGAVGSIIGGAFAGLVLDSALVHRLGLPASGLAGMVIGMTTIIGDLVESMFKRDAGVKDSGSIFPGHGGILDKVDGALFAGPVLYWTASALGLLS